MEADGVGQSDPSSLCRLALPLNSLSMCNIRKLRFNIVLVAQIWYRIKIVSIEYIDNVLCLSSPIFVIPYKSPNNSETHRNFINSASEL